MRLSSGFATVVLGAVFLIGQGTEYAHLIRENVTISANLFGTTFFTLTGFHGFHVFMGLVALDHPSRPRHWRLVQGAAFRRLEAVSLYWHFVDLVWIVIFATVYLWAAYDDVRMLLATAWDWQPSVLHRLHGAARRLRRGDAPPPSRQMVVSSSRASLLLLRACRRSMRWAIPTSSART